jgi:hypothetical protein
MPRSGTTLLAEQIARHPDIWIGPETHFFPAIGRNIELALEQGDYRNVVDLLRSLPGRSNCQLPQSAMDGALSDPSVFASCRTAAAVFLRLLDCLCRDGGLSVVGEKTPDHLLALDLILSESPATYGVIIVRDPRAVHASMMTVPWGGYSPERSAAKWNRFACETLLVKKRRPEQLHIVQYESFVREPSDALEVIWDALGLDSARPLAAGAPTFDLVSEPWKEGARGRPHTRSVNEWRTALPDSEAELLAALTRKASQARGVGLLGI